jgi:pentatricopeptide repeat protein
VSHFQRGRAKTTTFDLLGFFFTFLRLRMSSLSLAAALVQRALSRTSSSRTLFRAAFYSSTPSPSPSSTKNYNDDLRSLTKSRRVIDALDLCTRMHKAGQAPDALTYSLIMDVFAELGMRKTCETLMDDMKVVGIQPTHPHWHALLKAGFPAFLISLCSRKLTMIDNLGSRRLRQRESISGHSLPHGRRRPASSRLHLRNTHGVLPPSK